VALERGDAPLKRIAIVDENPAKQFLAPEFELFRQLVRSQHGIAAVVADPANSARRQAAAARRRAGRPDLQPADRFFTRCYGQRRNSGGFRCRRCGADAAPARPCAVCRQAQPDAALDEAALRAWACRKPPRKILLAGIPRTVAVCPEEGERFWAERKRWFFKPPAGFGSRAAYRGDKLTKRVFEEILHGGYIAQEIAPPSEHVVQVVEASSNDEGRYPLPTSTRGVFNCSPPVSIRARPPISGRRAAVLRRCSWLERVKFRHENFGIAGYSGSGKTTCWKN
jgi:hypothetical protein